MDLYLNSSLRHNIFDCKFCLTNKTQVKHEANRSAHCTNNPHQDRSRLCLIYKHDQHGSAVPHTRPRLYRSTNCYGQDPLNSCVFFGPGARCSERGEDAALRQEGCSGPGGGQGCWVAVKLLMIGYVIQECKYYV